MYFPELYPPINIWPIYLPGDWVSLRGLDHFGNGRVVRHCPDRGRPTYFLENVRGGTVYVLEKTIIGRVPDETTNKSRKSETKKNIWKRMLSFL